MNSQQDKTNVLNIVKGYFQKYELTHKEEQIKTIISNLIQHQGSHLFMDPIACHYYIDNKKLGYFVIVSDTFVKITNHKFYYTNFIGYKFSKELISVLQQAISEDRQRIEAEIFSNELELLEELEKKTSI